MTDNPLRELLAFDARVQREREQSPVFLHRRDRRFALDCADRGLTPSAAEWLRHLAAVGRIPGAQAEPPADPLRPWHRLQCILLIVGLLFGALCVAGILAYEGTQRINLTFIIALVGLQLLLALLTGLQSVLDWQPLRPVMLRFLPDRGTGAMASLQTLMLARAAQLGGVGFGLGGLGVLLIMILLQDLAFGWSTTLATGAESYHRFVLALSWPWRSVWPAAVPDLDLVEATRFFRVQSLELATRPERWGQWWPYVVALWSSYVIAPRALLALLAHLQLQWRARQALRLHPGYQSLQARMTTPVVDSSETAPADEVQSERMEPAANFVTLPEPAAVLCWAGAGQPTLPAALAGLGDRAHRAGGSATLDDDLQAIEAVAAELGNVPSDRRSVALLVHAWEPPTGELADFIRQARGSWPDGATLVLALQPIDAMAPLPGNLRTQWQHFAARLDGDSPLLAVLDGGEERKREEGRVT